jgi:Secretion system C-terminal sorting domain
MYKYLLFDIVESNPRKYSNYYSIKINFNHSLIIISIILFSTITLTAQVNNSAGVIYPVDYKILTSNILSNLNKPENDTLDYITFSKIKQDFLVNSGCGDYGADQLYVNVARDENGNYMCVWVEERTDLREINAQLFNNNDEKWGNVIIVSEQYNSWNSAPHIVYNYFTSEYLVTWAQSSNDIRLQRISNQGEKMGSNITVNQLSIINSNNPSAAVDKNGNILITWYSPKFGSISPYFRIFDKTGTAITDQKELVTGTYIVSSSGRDTRVASDSSGNFIVVWSSRFDSKSQIIMQVVSNDGQLVNENLIVSDPNDSTDNTFPTITSIKDGNYLILWPSDNYLKGRIYNIENGFLSNPFNISEKSSTWFSYSASSDDQNNFFIAWTGNGITYSQTISKQGNFIGNNKVLEISTPLTFISFPKLTKAINNTIYFAYYGYRKNDVDVMIQKFDLDFNSINSSVKVADDYCSGFQTNPISKYNNSGESIVVWNDKRDGTINLYGQVLDKEDNLVSENIMIHDSSKYKWAENPCITSDNEGNFIISFSAGENYDSRNLIIQKVTKKGEKIGDNKAITDGYYSNLKSFTEVNSNDDLLIGWYSISSSYPSVYMQKFDSDLIPYYDTIELLKSTRPKRILSLSINKNFNVLAMWVDLGSQSQPNVIKGMVFDEIGNSISDTIIVDSLAGGSNFFEGICQIDDDGNLVFVWDDYNQGIYLNINIKRYYPADNKIFFTAINPGNFLLRTQLIKFINKKLFVSWTSNENVNSIFLNDNDTSFIPVKLHNFDPFFNLWRVSYNHYSVNIFKNKLQFSYESIVNPEKGFDIWLNTQLIEQFDFDSVFIPTVPLPTKETVSSAYPNPSADIVTLNYEISTTVNVNITVFNILGQKISVIENGLKEPGTYTVSLNTKELASGIYFFYFKGRNLHTRKFLIIR